MSAGWAQTAQPITAELGDAVEESPSRLLVEMLQRAAGHVVRLLGGELTTPYQFIRVAEANRELGLDDEALAWAKRGIAT